MKKTTYKICLAALLCVLLLAGCASAGKDNTDSSEDTVDPATQEEESLTEGEEESEQKSLMMRKTLSPQKPLRKKAPQTKSFNRKQAPKGNH